MAERANNARHATPQQIRVQMRAQAAAILAEGVLLSSFKHKGLSGIEREEPVRREGSKGAGLIIDGGRDLGIRAGHGPTSSLDAVRAVAPSASEEAPEMKPAPFLSGLPNQELAKPFSGLRS